MPFSRLWGRITGADKGQKFPNQQVKSLGRTGDSGIVSPYGLYANLPASTLIKEIAENVFVSVTEARPADIEQGEPVFFHPATNTRIIAKNNGDLDISTVEAGGNVNIETVNANITASADVNIKAVNANITASASATVDTPTTTFTGDVQIDGALNVEGNITSLANIIATALMQGATLSISGAGSIDGKDFLSHTHAQGNDSDGDTQVNTGGIA
jgi:phosphotransferase system HPr-like phosphotransfer protein